MTTSTSLLIIKAVLSIVLLAFVFLTGTGQDIVLGAIVGFWLRESEHQVARRGRVVPRD